MDPMDLSFYTTQELIAELMQRPTFLGVVVHSAQEEKGQAWDFERLFKVHFNENLSASAASNLLDQVAEHMNLYPC